MAHSLPSVSNHRLGNLDEKSKAIIVELQHDGRKSYSAIGKSVGLSERPCDSGCHGSSNPA